MAESFKFLVDKIDEACPVNCANMRDKCQAQGRDFHKCDFYKRLKSERESELEKRRFRRLKF